MLATVHNTQSFLWKSKKNQVVCCQLDQNSRWHFRDGNKETGVFTDVNEMADVLTKMHDLLKEIIFMNIFGSVIDFILLHETVQVQRANNELKEIDQRWSLAIRRASAAM